MADDAFRLIDRLHITGPKIQTAAGDVLMGNAGVCVVNKTSGAATQVTLTARVGRGYFAFVKDGKGDAATNAITIVPDGTSHNTTIDGAANFVLNVNYGCAIFMNNGTEWNLIGVFLSSGNQGAVKATSVAIGAAGSEVTIAATPAELNRVAQASTRNVVVTSATLAITAAAHGERVVLLDTTHTQTITLPQATGSGDVYTFVVKTLGTDGSKIIQVANTTDVIQGIAQVANTQNTTDSFITSATSDTVTMNNTTQGGLVGSEVIIRDIVAGTFTVLVRAGTTGNPATPFSASV